MKPMNLKHSLTFEVISNCKQQYILKRLNVLKCEIFLFILFC
jgi:hypothetical protein